MGKKLSSEFLTSKHDQQAGPDVWLLPGFRADRAVKAELASKNIKEGQVVSIKMAKTIVVEVIRSVPHPIYRRIVSKRRRFHAHDEEEVARMGDVVRIIECRPLSKMKRWRLEEVLRKADDLPVFRDELEQN
jgi:small subunit ribosomal protein S17